MARRTPVRRTSRTTRAQLPPENRAILARYLEAKRFNPELTQGEIALSILPLHHKPGTPYEQRKESAARQMRKLFTGERKGRTYVQRAAVEPPHTQKERERIAKGQRMPTAGTRGFFQVYGVVADTEGGEYDYSVTIVVPLATRLDAYRIARQPQTRAAVRAELAKRIAKERRRREGSLPAAGSDFDFTIDDVRPAAHSKASAPPWVVFGTAA